MGKYADPTPLYRLSQIYVRQGVDIGRSTLTDLVCDTAYLLTPLAQAIGRHVLSAQKVHTDDTPIRVLGGKGNKARTGRLLWAMDRLDAAPGQQAHPPPLRPDSGARQPGHAQRARQYWHNVAMNDPKLIEALSNASNLELFQLSAVIDRMLQDPRRILAVRSKLHLGQTVRFVDWRDGQMRSGRIVMLKGAQAIIHDLRERKECKLPYAAIEPPAGPPQPAQPTEPAERVQAAKPGRNDFRCGERVSFQDRYLQTQIGTIVRINQRTATVDCGTESWRVPFAALRHVLDV